ncbi:MAG: ABC transporter substrate-binding protein [Gloeomargarita sp. SKYG116]|nr:ABC transporter substrate-binding protein [Gloeomargarita sp. SKYG116]MDW8401113.1 ABC transporter substrate-binding protein [Gloeomargarita sp. SKYGB_i_bin116]
MKQLVIGLLLLFLLLGCQRTETPGPLVLTLWHGINPPANRVVFEQLVADFNARHTDIKIQPIYIGQADQQFPKILTAIVGNSPPDLLWFDSLLTGRLVDLQGVIPLTDWLQDGGYLDNLDPALIPGMEFEGELWSVPFTMSNLGIFYRPDLFAEAGIKTLPRTWEELAQVAQKLTQDRDGDGRLDQYGLLLPLGKGEWTVFSWLPFWFSAGGEVVNQGMSLLTTASLKALRFWQELLRMGVAVLSAPERGYEQEWFIQGRVAMQITGPWTLGYLTQTGVPFAVMPIPQAERPATIVGGANVFVMRTDPLRQRAALQFLDYILSDEFQVAWAVQTGALPVTQSARRDPTYQAFLTNHPLLQVFLDQMPFAYSRPNGPNYNRVSNCLGRAIEATLLGQAPEVALERYVRFCPGGS